MEIQEKLLQLLNSDSPEMRRKAAISISREQNLNLDTVDALTEGLNDDDSGVRDIIFNALLNIPDELKAKAAFKVSDLIGNSDIAIRNLAGDLLMKFKEHSVDALVSALDTPNADDIKYACDILGQVGNLSVKDKIYHLFDYPDPNVRASAIEALGNLGDSEIVQKLIQIYSEEEDLRPNVIEALGKIGGDRAQEFLFGLMTGSEDLFIKISGIDALAHSGTDFSICEKLIEELPNVHEEIQVYLLKTIYAIAFRLEREVELPNELRHVARMALKEEDQDSRIAGLIALGNSYETADIEVVGNEIWSRNTETQQMITYNLFTFADENTIRIFFRFLATQFDKEAFFIDYLGLVREFLPETEIPKVEAIFKGIIDAFIEKRSSLADETFDVLKNMHELCFSNVMCKMLSESSENKAGKIIELVPPEILTGMPRELNTISGKYPRLRENVDRILNKAN